MNESDHTGDKPANDLTNLSDVIRRHAEELARLSGRLAYDAAHPPPGAPVPPPIQTGAMFPPRADQSTTLPARAGDPALSDDSMPVLSAFREFLEQERLRTRRRMMRIGYLTLAAVMTVVSVALLTGHWYVKQTRLKLEAAQFQVEAARRMTDSKLNKFSDRAIKLENALARERQDLHNAAGAASNHLSKVAAEQTAVVQNQSTIVERLLEQSVELEKMRDAITTLEIEKASLAGSLKTMAAQLESYKSAGVEPATTTPEAETAPVVQPPAQPLVPFRLPEP